jgi:hypothetical protein
VFFHHLGIDAAVGLWEADDLDAPPFEGEPGRHIGGELLAADQDLVAFVPVQTFGDQRQTFGSAADDRNVVGSAACKLAAEVATAQVVVLPLLVVVVTGLLLLGDTPAHCLRHRPRQRADRRMIEKERVLPYGKLREPISELENHDGMITRIDLPRRLRVKGEELGRNQERHLTLYSCLLTLYSTLDNS